MTYNFKTLLFLIVSLTVFNNHTFSQEKSDSIYGLNPFLYNGQVYSYILPSTVKGNQYLINSDFIPGDIEIVGKYFEHCLLNYDIYNQEILLRFKLDQRTVILKLSKEKVTQFTLQDKLFKILTNSDSTKSIYQVFGSKKYKVFYYWYKELKLSNVSGSSNYVFSKPKKKMYLQFDNQQIKYRNNRTFLSIFDKEQKSKIKKFIKQHHLNVKKISDTKLILLINYCNTLEN